MPSSIPVGFACMAIVFARLLVKGEDWGVRPFIVQLNDILEESTKGTSILTKFYKLASLLSTVPSPLCLYPYRVESQ